MHKIIYLPIARNDVLDTVAYLAQRLGSPGAAESLLQQLEATVDSIARFPYAYELYRTDRPLKNEIRKAPVKGYVLYYSVSEDRVEILRLLHGRRSRTIDQIDPEEITPSD